MKNNQYTKIGCKICVISQKVLSTFLPCSSSSFEEVYLNNHKTNDLASLHVEMYHYRIGNRGIVNPCSSCTTDHYLSQQCIMIEDN